MLTEKDILNLYNKYNVKASKRFGQNFIHNNNVIESIIKGANIEGKNVIEIGPGLGSLTIPLLDKAKNVEAFEIDKDMIKVLSGEIKNKNFNLIKDDFLKTTFNWKEKKYVVANIPYNITSQILFKLFKNKQMFISATLMVQKEVGERLFAKPNTKQYGKLSVSAQLLGSVKKIIEVDSSSFTPSPKVDSVVFKIIFNNSEYEPTMMNFIKNCFSQQRKKLINNLKPFYNLDKIKKIIIELNLNENIRPQQIEPKVFLEFYKLLYN